MKLYYYQHPEGNFGDDLNLWLWPRLVPGLLEGRCRHHPALLERNDDEDALFLGIGTILNTDVPPSPQKYVFGAGTGYGAPPRLGPRWHIYCVRGPLTAQALGLPLERAVGDPALLVRLLDLPPPEAEHEAAYLPHVSVAEPWRELCEEVGVPFIDPRAPVDEVIARIRGCRLLLTEAMHGAIVADALRVPWIPVRSYRHINAFKWRDWCLSLGLEYRPQFLTPIWRPEPDAGMRRRLELKARKAAAAKALRRLLHRGRAQLSPALLLGDALDRLRRRLDELRDDHLAGRLAAAPPAENR